MLGSFRKSSQHLQALERVQQWTRERFSLAQDAVILVTEVSCTVPGCPPLETVVAFWEHEKRHHFKIFKPVEEVLEEDLPYYWLKDSLIDIDGLSCSCC